jgi:hypothetical protein
VATGPYTALRSRVESHLRFIYTPQPPATPAAASGQGVVVWCGGVGVCVSRKGEVGGVQSLNLL